FGGAFRLGIEPILVNNFSVREEDKGGYVQGDWKTTLGSWGFRGNVGLRYVKTRQSSTGYSFLSNTTQLVTSERSYDDWLPSLNVVFEPHDNFLIRASAAKVMARPNL